ncbi:MAG: EAL domain-containing protein [Oscillospiraceae bacterium]|nr:EAL domain-containing protein [Oscillospiraceae bacterium]
MKTLYGKLYDYMEDSRILQCIRSGLVMSIPILLLGSIGLVLKSFPIAAYQNFIKTFCSGILFDVFSFIYDGTFGILAVYMTATISLCYAKQFMEPQKYNYGTVLTALTCFAIFSGVGSAGFSFDAFGVKGMFLAIVCSLAGSALYLFFSNHITQTLHLYADGADAEFKISVGMFVPIGLTALVFALLNYLVTTLTGTAHIQEFIISVANNTFLNMGRGLGSGLLFVLMSSIFWFFGIHGSDVLENVCDNLFTPAVAINEAQLLAGQAPTELFSKTFFDVFVLMGGCGVAMCLLAALLIFSKRRSNHALARLAAIPMLFNINEIMVFGLPVVFNPILLIPFLLTPVVITLTSYGAMTLGLVPLAAHSVEWTTPFFFSGYMATGSIAGALLQLFNLALGTVIYIPFVKEYDREKMRNAKSRMDKLVSALKYSEESGEPISLLTLPNAGGVVAKTLAVDLRRMIMEQTPTMYYQAQFDNHGQCIGAEALLRWNHPLYGMVYPPLAVKLAAETGILTDMEAAVFKKVASDMPRLKQIIGPHAKICVNVSAVAMQSDEIVKTLKQILNQGVQARDICIEVTEQMTMQFNDDVIARFDRIRKAGFSLAIDDFSMGSTSLRYLQENLFDLVKLDGALVQDMMVNERSAKIVASLVQLSRDLGFQLLAEYVETAQQKQALEALGCYLYQGWLYSPALPIDEMSEKLEAARLSAQNKNALVSQKTN